MNIGRVSTLVVASAGLAGGAAAQGVGYDDTPRIPGQPWKVHDKNRPNPPVVDPGPAGDPAPVPADATVLMGDGSLDAWQHGDGRAAEWDIVEGGVTQVKAGTGDILTREHFGDCQLHVEWATPAQVVGESQGRGNSGVFFFGRYEIQILDSYENKTYADGQAASLYGQFPPDVNASRAPGEWQSYDIIFEAPRFSADGELERPAYVTVIHNGIVVHNRRAFLGATSHRSFPSYQAHEEAGPIKLQDHGNPMRFRNIWVRPIRVTEDGTGAPTDDGAVVR